jgi:hypothetical protein
MSEEKFPEVLLLLEQLYSEVREAHKGLGLVDGWPMELDEVSDRVGNYLDEHLYSKWTDPQIESIIHEGE